MYVDASDGSISAAPTPIQTPQMRRLMPHPVISPSISSPATPNVVKQLRNDDRDRDRLPPGPTAGERSSRLKCAEVSVHTTQKESFLFFVAGEAARDAEKHREFIATSTMWYDLDINLHGKRHSKMDAQLSLMEKEDKKIDLETQLIEEQLKYYKKRNR